MKLLKTIRFDASDERVFERAAAPGEWAISGSFAFAHFAGQEIGGKAKQAFANGFLGLSTFGRSTFAAVASAGSHEFDAIGEILARHFVDHYAAPNPEAAMRAAKEEIGFVQELCRDAPINTVFTVRRTWDEDRCIKEEFRTIRPPAGEQEHARIWTVPDDEG